MGRKALGQHVQQRIVLGLHGAQGALHAQGGVHAEAGMGQEDAGLPRRQGLAQAEEVGPQEGGEGSYRQ